MALTAEELSVIARVASKVPADRDELDSDALLGRIAVYS